MRKAGGIIALVAGIFGVLAAGFTLLVGGVGSAFKADNAQMVVGLGWGGVVFSFIVIVLGAVAMGSNSRIPGMLLVIASIAGAILGGTFVAIFMLLAFVGGVLAAIPASRAATQSA
ncbi:hypothetical protein [Bradyrhizobium diazoefficiens]|uniref:Membrane protein n=1 Tax=Bradyrhizobium diazoefficiens TaxID=1355477 RepID=A0A810BFY4_9BRAD|nr:hypothetical protein [Bradyrhizobium diazoefficiens]WLB35598.1 hypothetical protein QIH78_29515 [Bradyrhizobium diazoefficiens]WLC19410.1 hypothetical protein QIH76_14155 [Bradyrhizobium diazoefficiens]BCE75552.1 membrane protein [Bradyrhizobium diazoefficiens]